MSQVIAATRDKVRVQTICGQPDLFKIVCQIRVDVFKQLLTHHLNQPFIDSVIVGLWEGFWPFADTMKEGYPKLWDGLYWPLKTEKERLFLMEQVETEITARHLSKSFGTDLLLGMYSPLVHAIPKLDSELLWLIIDHSSGDFSPNLMIACEDIAGVHLDGIHSLGASILQIKAHDLEGEPILFKSNVSAAYRQLPMHPLYQILQVIMVNSQQYIDRNNNFRGRASQIIWQSFISLVVWILVFKQDLKWLKCYDNDIFSISAAWDITWYPPYHQTMPNPQAKVLQLWDEINLLHSDEKQISGKVTPILGFKVNPNAMSAALSGERQKRLVDTIWTFTQGSAKPLQEWLRIAGQINWALNIYL